MFWIILIAIIVIIYIVKGNGYFAARARNSIKAWAIAKEGYCHECKHCVKDETGQRSRTGYFCALSKCQNITEETRMNCFEKPKITEEDLQALFDLGIWNDAGKQFLRSNLLGKAMTWTELDNYLKQLPIDHPEFISGNQ